MNLRFADTFYYLDTNFTPGIYNYCDRWCERCSFTGRCRVSSMQEARAGTDPQNAAFWEQLKQVRPICLLLWLAAPITAQDSRWCVT